MSGLALYKDQVSVWPYIVGPGVGQALYKDQVSVWPYILGPDVGLALYTRTRCRSGPI